MYEYDDANSNLQSINQRRTKHESEHKHVLDETICRRCNHPMEDRHHVFFGCPLSLSSLPSADLPLQEKTSTSGLRRPLLGMTLRDLAFHSPTNFSVALVGRKKWHNLQKHSVLNAVSRICDDLTIWEGKFASASMVPGLRQSFSLGLMPEQCYRGWENPIPSRCSFAFEKKNEKHELPLLFQRFYCGHCMYGLPLFPWIQASPAATNYN